ncbi:MAG: DUF2141 domain-containing protein [Sphingomonadales bacterium]|nr:DUF2141 domain-containing protein [Sphingomonadales bacterium]MDE2171681.1 DUF2141 domain-containing protein [Sphingomonadales bacterium]
MIAALMVMAAAAPGAATGGPVVVQVANVRNSRGRVYVALCPKDKFLADTCPYEASAPARPGVTTVVIEHVPAGEWGAQAFHDENGNHEIDRGFLGIPKEGVGFSRDARIVLGPPKWRDAVFTHGAERQGIGFKLRYFTGPGSPEAWAEEHPAK